MSKEKSDKCIKGVEDAIKADFPEFILFCAGSNGGFAYAKMADKEADDKLKAQIVDTLESNDDLYAWMKDIMSLVNYRKKAN